MTRFLAFCLIASLAVVGCGDDSGTGGSGGSAGSGGTAGSGGVGGRESCIENLNILDEIEEIAALIQEICIDEETTCGFPIEAICIAECLREEFTLPQACAECLGQTGQCIYQECEDACMTIQSQECEACVIRGGELCAQLFEECAGIPPR